MDVTVLVFNGVASREVVAPLTALNDVQECTVRWVARQPGAVHGFEPVQRFDVTDGVDQVAPTDLLLIPGGLGSIRMMEDPEVVDWAGRQRRAGVGRHERVHRLAAPGRRRAARRPRTVPGHWLASGELEAAGAHPSEDPVTWTGNIVTTSGAMAAADVAATLPDRMAYRSAAVLTTRPPHRRGAALRGALDSSPGCPGSSSITLGSWSSAIPVSV